MVETTFFEQVHEELWVIRRYTELSELRKRRYEIGGGHVRKTARVHDGPNVLVFLRRGLFAP